MKDEELIDRVAQEYTPPPMTPARAARFDAALAGRRQRRSRAWLLVPAGALAAAWLALGTADVVPGPTPASAPLPAVALDDGFDAPLFADADDSDEFGVIPADYEMLASLTDAALGWGPEDSFENWEVQ